MLPRNELLAYAAGLFDGEGCCGVYTEGHKHCAIRMHVTMCTPRGPSLFAELFGGHVKAATWRRKKPAGGYYEATYYLPVYIWSVTADNAANALRELLPWLREKRAQAELVIEAREIQRGRKGQGVGIGRGHGSPYTEAELTRLGEIRAEVKALKRVS